MWLFIFLLVWVGRGAVRERNHGPSDAAPYIKAGRQARGANDAAGRMNLSSIPPGVRRHSPAPGADSGSTGFSPGGRTCSNTLLAIRWRKDPPNGPTPGSPVFPNTKAQGRGARATRPPGYHCRQGPRTFIRPLHHLHRAGGWSQEARRSPGIPEDPTGPVEERRHPTTWGCFRSPACSAPFPSGPGRGPGLAP